MSSSLCFFILSHRPVQIKWASANLLLGWKERSSSPEGRSTIGLYCMWTPGVQWLTHQPCITCMGLTPSSQVHSRLCFWSSYMQDLRVQGYVDAPGSRSKGSLYHTESHSLARQHVHDLHLFLIIVECSHGTSGSVSPRDQRATSGSVWGVLIAKQYEIMPAFAAYLNCFPVNGGAIEHKWWTGS